MVPVLLVSEASLGPYAWQYNGTKKLKLSHGNARIQTLRICLWLTLLLEVLHLENVWCLKV